jgi:FLVCR family MFS transporter
VYGRRWLVLTFFSLLGFLQGMVWNSWGPIQNSAIRAFGFNKSDIAVLVLWGPVGYIPWLLFMWLMDNKGEFSLVGSLRCPTRSLIFMSDLFSGII